MIRFVYGFLPVFVFYSAAIDADSDEAGYSIGPIVTIRNYCKSDGSVLVHELEHVKMWYRTFGLSGFLYFLSRRWKAFEELNAYAHQVAFFPEDQREDKIEWCAIRLCSGYNLGLRYECTKNMLRNAVKCLTQ